MLDRQGNGRKKWVFLCLKTHKKKLIFIQERELQMSEHKCDHFCQEYGCEQFKEKPYNDLSKGTINTNPKPKGECPVSSFSAGVNHKEPMPKKNDSKPIWDMVIEDMKERDSVGEERYGTRLQKFNGRNSAVDEIGRASC